MARRKEIDRDHILDSAEEIILESGGRQFTLDAVAERAGISKGGLVYNFATKDELIAAALEREMARFQGAVDARVGEEHRKDPIRLLLGYLEEALAEDEVLVRKAAFLTMAVVQTPEMARPARDFYARLFSLFETDTPRGRDIRQALLAVEGLFLLRGMGFVNVSAEEWRSVLRHARDTVLQDSGRQ